MTQIAQAYLHLKPFSLNEEIARGLADAADSAARFALERSYSAQFDIEIVVQDGSGKVRTIVHAISLTAALEAAHLIYGTIADYKGFKDSIEELCNDSRKFGEIVCDSIPKAVGIKQSSVYRTERRLGTPGRINRVLSQIEQLKISSDDLSPNKLKSELTKIERALERIGDDLAEEDHKALETVRDEHGDILPPSKPNHHFPDAPRVAIVSRNVKELSSQAWIDESLDSDRVWFHKVVAGNYKRQRLTR